MLMIIRNIHHDQVLLPGMEDRGPRESVTYDIFRPLNPLAHEIQMGYSFQEPLKPGVVYVLQSSLVKEIDEGSMISQNLEGGAKYQVKATFLQRPHECRGL